MSFGVWELQNDWFGTPFVKNGADDAMFYRIFRPDPIWFYDSFVQRFGTMANEIETIVYYYVGKINGNLIITSEYIILNKRISNSIYKLFSYDIT